MSEAPAGARVVLRRCPECGASLLGQAGSAWFTCTGCPQIVDVYGRLSGRVATFRLRAETPEAGCHLPFFLFRLAQSPELMKAIGPPRGHPQPTPETDRPLPVWVNAFRVDRVQIYGDVGARLTAMRYDPGLVAAPLGCPVARGPEQAMSILRIRHRLGPEISLDVVTVSVVALPWLADGHHLVDPLSGLSYPTALIRPHVALTPAP
jgi:hypothetical protein